MAEPKKRLTRTRSGNRQSHDRLVSPSLLECSNCKTMILPHRVCDNCGFYNGKKVVMDKSEKSKEKEIKKELENE